MTLSRSFALACLGVMVFAGTASSSTYFIVGEVSAIAAWSGRILLTGTVTFRPGAVV